MHSQDRWTEACGLSHNDGIGPLLISLLQKFREAQDFLNFSLNVSAQEITNKWHFDYD